MSTANGHSTTGPAAVAGARPLMLLRYRSGITGQAGRTVHLVPLPPGGQAGAAGVALCGALLCPDQVETVTPGHGVPCSMCMVSHLSASPQPTPATAPLAHTTASETSSLAAAVCYKAWGWPVTLRGDQVWLNLEPDKVALIIPMLLAAQVTEILRQRRCLPLVLAHPDTPEYWVLPATERYAVTLPWPPGMYRATGTVPLPPATTARGPVTWVHPPEADALRQCREIDIFTAVRAAQRDPPT